MSGVAVVRGMTRARSGIPRRASPNPNVARTKAARKTMPRIARRRASMASPRFAGAHGVVYNTPVPTSSVKERLMTQKSFALLFFVLAFAAAGFAQAQSPVPAKPADVAGVWEMTMQTPQGEMTRDATFTQEKDAVKVTMEGPMGEMKGEGTVKENEVQWTMSISTPNGDFALIFKAKVDGDKMTGEIQMGDMGTSIFSAKKKK